jgi:hypothetical protein
MAVSSIGEKYFPIFIIQNQKQTALTGEEDLEFEAGFKKVDCIIYMYCKPGTDFGVYVGQTMQTLKERDKQHLAGRKQEFDKVYTSKSKFELKALEKKTFTANIQSKSEWTRFIKSYGEWMDEREKYYIKHYDTYVDPIKFQEKWLDTQWDKLNRDPGGQGLERHVRNAQSAFERSLNTFRTKYWPAMQAFLETERAKLPCGTPSLMMVEQNERIIGILIINIRRGNTSVPAFYKKLMLEHGHVDNWVKGMWEHVRWPSIEAFLKTKRAKLPVSGTPSLMMANQRKDEIGKLIVDIRDGHTSVPAFYKKMLDEHGMFWSKSNVAKHLLRKLGIRRHVSARKFEIDRNISLDPAENEEIAVCLEKSRCFLLDEKFNGSKVKMASKKHTSSRETFIEKYRKDLQSIVEKE